jgi:hypothetical protein
MTVPPRRSSRATAAARKSRLRSPESWRRQGRRRSRTAARHRAVRRSPHRSHAQSGNRRTPGADRSAPRAYPSQQERREGVRRRRDAAENSRTRRLHQHHCYLGAGWFSGLRDRLDAQRNRQRPRAEVDSRSSLDSSVSGWLHGIAPSLSCLSLYGSFDHGARQSLKPRQTHLCNRW